MTDTHGHPDAGEGQDPGAQAVAGPTDGREQADGYGSTQEEKSRYDPRPSGRPGRPGPAPLKVRIELVLVSGPEGKQLRMRQAAAIRVLGYCRG